ncbi:MAG: hypothetical protein EOO61_03715 [Hymenobacter sp.]|nr:MAG: hypothetical protein EOO61_03715 [Hymenobacter sp.]
MHGPPHQFLATGAPSTDTIVQTVSVLAGLPVYYSAYLLELICPALGLRVTLYEDEASDYHLMKTGTPQTDYLQVTTVKALQQLGGRFEGGLPSWAGQSWNQLTKWKYRLQRQYIYYPPDVPW